MCARMRMCVFVCPRLYMFVPPVPFSSRPAARVAFPPAAKYVQIVWKLFGKFVRKVLAKQCVNVVCTVSELGASSVRTACDHCAISAISVCKCAH
jgi:uncharacterized protein (DUF697 family)